MTLIGNSQGYSIKESFEALADDGGVEEALISMNYVGFTGE
jgi:hypothetical protein